MKNFMIVMNSLENCYHFMKFKRLPQSECILISTSTPGAREQMLGYYNQVMNDEIELFGITKEQFHYMYNNGVIDVHNIKKKLKSSSLANKELKIIKGYLKGNSIVIEDWWKKIAGENWQASAFHNPAAYNYCLNHQSEYSNHSVSVNWVLYGKIGGLGYLVNVKELDLPKDYNPEEDYVFE